MGRLSTHVLDTANGRPAEGVRVEVKALGADGGARLIASATTNSDGRAEPPLLVGQDLAPGRYELVFHIGRYFATAASGQAGPPFLDDVPVRFTMREGEPHYHVPLLVTPWGYTTYRGS